MRIDCDVSYDAALDRLVGGDFVRELNDKWIRSFLMPATRARQLLERLQQLDAAFRADHGDAPAPFPQPLAMTEPGSLPGAIDGRPQMVPLDLAFSTERLRSAPEEHRDVVQLVCVIEDPTTLAERRPDTAAGRRELAVNLFGVLSCVHRRLYMALTSSAGSSIEQSTVSPSGHLQDVYFLVGPGEVSGAEISQGQRQDLIRALSLLISLDVGHQATRSVLVDAVAAYWRTPALPSSVASLLDRVASGREAANSDNVAELAAAVLSGG